MNNNGNAVRKEDTYRAVEIDISQGGRRVEFMDADKFEEEIRMDERRKWVEKDIRRHQRERERRELKKKIFWYKLVSRMIGCALLALIYFGSKLTGEGGIAVLLPMAVAFIIAPTPENL